VHDWTATGHPLATANGSGGEVDKRLRRWATTRVIPLVAAAVLLVVGVNVGIEWNPLHGSMGFAGAFDVWRSYGVTDQILNGHLAQVYSPHRA